MRKKKNKKVLLVILLILGLILVGTGTSLAYFSYKEDVGNKILLGDDIFISLEELPEEMQYGEPLEIDQYTLLGNGGMIADYSFVVRGHNTNEKPIYFALYLEHGDDVPGKVRIDDNLLASMIVNSNDYSNKVALINNFEVPIYIGKIEGGSDVDQEIMFGHKVLLLPFNLSDTDPNALYSASTEGVIRYGKPKMSDLFGSFKLKMVASTKEIEFFDTPYIKNNYEKADENGVYIDQGIDLMLFPAYYNATYEMAFERPTRSSGILASTQPGFATGFAIDYTAETSTFNFYLGIHEYHFQYPHNDNDVVNGIDKIILKVDPNNVTINGTVFPLTNGTIQGTSPDFDLVIGYGGLGNVAYMDPDTDTMVTNYHSVTYPDYEGTFYYLKNDIPQYDGTTNSAIFIPLIIKNDTNNFAIIEENTGMIYKGSISLEMLFELYYGIGSEG